MKHSRRGMLRNGSTDIERFTQWIGRKIKNHDPLKELDAQQHGQRRMPTVVKVLRDGSGVIARSSSGRRFEIIVREMDVNEPTRAVVDIKR